MDEVFDLKERNQWLRRNIKNLLQQLIKATYGDTINRCDGHVIIHALWLIFLLSVQQQTFVFASLQENRGSRRLHDLSWASVWLCEEIQVMVTCVYCLFWNICASGSSSDWVLRLCRDSYWPNGILAETPPRRDKSLRMRTRVAAKTTLLGIMPGTYNEYCGKCYNK